MGRSSRRRGASTPKTPAAPVTRAEQEEAAEETPRQPPAVLVTPEQLGEALRDVVVPLQPPEGVQANRDAVEQEPPLRDDTLQENNNASVEEAPPPQPFPNGENEETIVEIPPELRRQEMDDPPRPGGPAVGTPEVERTAAAVHMTPAGMTARGGRQRFCIRIHVLNADTGGPFRPGLFTPSVIQDQLNLVLRRAGVPTGGEVTLLSGHEALAWCGDRHFNEGWSVDHRDQMEAHLDNWTHWLGRPAILLATILPVAAGRRQLGDEQRRQRRVRAESQPNLWLGPTMRPPGGPAAPPEPRGRGFVRRAHMSHEERRAAQARRRLADWQRDLTQASAAEASAAEALSGEESDAESEAGGNVGGTTPRQPGWMGTADWRARPSMFDAAWQRGPPPFGLPTHPYAPYDHPPYGYTQEAARQARALTAIYGEHWTPHPFADDVSFWSPYGGAPMAYPPPAAHPPGAPRAAPTAGAETDREDGPAAAPSRRTRRSRRTKDQEAPRFPPAAGNANRSNNGATGVLAQEPTELREGVNPEAASAVAGDRASATASRNTGSVSCCGDSSRSRSRSRSRSGERGRNGRCHDIKPRRIPQFNGEGTVDDFNSWLWQVQSLLRDQHISEASRTREILSSLTGRAGFLMTRLRTEKGDRLTAKDVVNAAKKLFGYTEKYARLLGQLSARHQGRNESVSDYATQKLALAAMVADHPNNPMSREDFEELERSTFYDGLRPSIRSLVTVEYNAKIDIWALSRAAREAEAALDRDASRSSEGNTNRRTREKDHEKDRARRADAPFSQRHAQWEEEEGIDEENEQRAEAADEDDDEEEPAAFVQRMTQMAQDDQNKRRTCGHCGERHTAVNPWTRCPKLRQTMTDRLNRGGTPSQAGRGPPKQDDRSGRQNGSSRGSRPPPPQNKKEPPAGSNAPSGGSTA